MDFNLLIAEQKRFLLVGIFKDFVSRAQCEEWLIAQPKDTSLIEKIKLFVQWENPDELQKLLTHGKKILITETTNLIPACVNLGVIAHDYPLVIRKK